MREAVLNVEKEDEGIRLDTFISEELSDISRSYVQKLVQNGNVLVNGTVRKNNYRLSDEDEIRIQIPDPVVPDIIPENIPLDIIYEDDYILIINKPKEMVVHPSHGHYEHTLVNALLYHCKDSLSGINGVLRPGIVHRLDMNTTGLLVVCKTDPAHRDIAGQIKEHRTLKKYRAIVTGRVKDDELTISLPIGRSKKDRKKMAVDTINGKEAVTHVRILERFREYTYVECILETGRTHQIRVHLSHIGHPVLGDNVYGPSKSRVHGLTGQTLHAKTLGLYHPATGEYMEFDSELPDYFCKLLATFRAGVK